MLIRITTPMLREVRTMLLVSDGPVTLDSIQGRLSISRRTAYRLMELLKQKLPGQIIGLRGSYTLELQEEAPDGLASENYGSALPDALMRGWVNPTTGLVPDHLGL